MQLVELRDLDGPNLFALAPTIKLEVSLDKGELLSRRTQDAASDLLSISVPEDPLEALAAVINHLHEHLGLSAPRPDVHEMDTPGHFSVCFLWERRAIARAIAQAAFDILTDQPIEDLDSHLLRAVEAETTDDDQFPTWVRDAERKIPAVAVTGTNGKTTTTRLLAHILKHAGMRVGWSSSSGVYIQGEMVIKGDYTGHGGARRVLTDPDIDCAVLETARGGILLRGLGYESNDVSVFLNLSEDHLDLQGVRSLETLARVKATVVRTTRPGGTVVLNADDPIVLSQKNDIRAGLMLFSQQEVNPEIEKHILAGGRAMTLHHGWITLHHGGRSEAVVKITAVPLTYGGAARHMVENALAACAAAIALGIEPKIVSEALCTFLPDRDHNAGRLNVFDLGGITFILDFAHNESGLTFLLDFARQLVPDASRLTAIIGTAGDRQDSVFVGLGRIAGEHADRVLIKTNPGFLRGRTPEQTVGLVLDGLAKAGRLVDQSCIYESEHSAATAAIETAENGEVIVIMCVEDYVKIMDELATRGASVRRSTVT